MRFYARSRRRMIPELGCCSPLPSTIVPSPTLALHGKRPRSRTMICDTEYLGRAWCDTSVWNMTWLQGICLGTEYWRLTWWGTSMAAYLPSSPPLQSRTTGSHGYATSSRTNQSLMSGISDSSLGSRGSSRSYLIVNPTLRSSSAPMSPSGSEE